LVVAALAIAGATVLRLRVLDEALVNADDVTPQGGTR
jgi:hypothetical protein